MGHLGSLLAISETLADCHHRDVSDVVHSSGPIAAPCACELQKHDVRSPYFCYVVCQ